MTWYWINILHAVSTLLYWAKVLTDHPKNCDNVFVVQYFGMNFGTFNENTIWHQSCASAGIWHSACSLRMHKQTKPLKCTFNSRNDLNRSSNHRNLKNNVFALKWQYIDTQLSKHMAENDLQNGGWQFFRHRSWHSVKRPIVSRLLPSQLIQHE